MSEMIDARTATQLLGIGRQTLYAYVSRGLLHAEPDPADPRRSRYRAEEIQALAARKVLGRKPERVARAAGDADAGGCGGCVAESAGHGGGLHARLGRPRCATQNRRAY